MSYEILLADSVREDIENRQAVLQPLLDRIAESAEYDHVLSAPDSQFELRYQFHGVDYLFFRRDEKARQAVIVYAEIRPGIRMVDMQTREIPHGMEVEGTFEVRNPDGTAEVQRRFSRKIDLGDFYMMVHHTAAGTMMLTGKKGRIDGDFRHDDLEMIHLKPDGTVQRFPAHTVPVWIKNPFEGDGRPLDERMRDYLRSPLFQQRMESARKWFSMG